MSTPAVRHVSHCRCQQHVVDAGRDGLDQLRGLQRELPDVRHVSVHVRRRRAQPQAAAVLAHRLRQLSGAHHRRESRQHAVPLPDMSRDDRAAARRGRLVPT